MSACSPGAPIPRSARSRISPADLIARIVRELDDAHAEVGEEVDAVGPLTEHRGVLEAVDDPDLSLLLGA